MRLLVLFFLFMAACSGAPAPQRAHTIPRCSSRTDTLFIEDTGDVVRLEKGTHYTGVVHKRGNKWKWTVSYDEQGLDAGEASNKRKAINDAAAAIVDYYVDM